MYYHGYGGGWGPDAWVLGALALAAPFVVIFLLWSLFWKGLALWHAAQRGQYWWFVILLIVNTLGILEIIYLFFVAKLKFDELFTVHHSHSGHEHSHSHSHDHSH